MTTCECGCGEELPVRTKPSRGPRRFIHNHHRRKSAVAYVVDGNGCWLWQRALSSDGYATAGIGNRRTAKVHSRNYQEKYGEVPEGHELHHICGVRSCVNPDHLESVTRLEHRHRHPRKGEELKWAT